MSQNVMAILEAKNQETFNLGETKVIAAQFFANEYGDSIQLALRGIAKRYYIPTRIAWDMVKRFTKKTALHEEHLELFAGSTALWAMGRVLVPGVVYTNAKGEEFELNEESSAKLDFIGFNVEFNSREIRSFKAEVDADCTPESIIYAPESVAAGVDISSELLDEPELITEPVVDKKDKKTTGKVDAKVAADESFS